MNKLNQKTEEGVLIISTLFVLVSSMFNAIISIILASSCLLLFFAYNLVTKK